MSDPSLHQLERDVEAARAKLAGQLSSLRSPAAYSEFSSELKYEALEMKDALVDKAKSSVQSTIDTFVEDLKARAAANPVAALAIGAGIAWRLIQRPPIATALIGAGLYRYPGDPRERADHGRISRPGKGSTGRAGERPREDREGQRIRDRWGRSGEGNRARDWSERACTGNGRSRNRKGNETRCRCDAERVYGRSCTGESD
jgi:hypothetical protein